MLKKSLVVVVAVFVFSNLAHSIPIYLKKNIFDPEKIPVERIEPLFSFGDEFKAQNFLVQFKSVISESLKQDLLSHNVEILSYIPENTLVLSLTRDQIINFKNSSDILGIFPLKFEYKISEKIKPVSIFDKETSFILSIQIFDHQFQEELISFLESNNQEIFVASKKRVIARISYDLLYKVAQFSSVEWIERYEEPQFLYYPMMTLDEKEPQEPPTEGDYDKLTGYESGVRILRTQLSYQMGLLGQRQIVAMADTGVSQGKIDKTLHQDLKDRLLKGYAEGFFSNSWADPLGHGTHVAGSIAGDGFTSKGKIRGTAYASGLIVQSMMTGLGGMFPPQDLHRLFEKTYNDGARIHSNSWGLPMSHGEYESFSVDVDQFSWEFQDFLPVFAAGNNGGDFNKDGIIDERSILAPSVAKNSLSVGASENLVFVGGIQRKWGVLLDADKKWGVPPISEDLISDNENGVAAFSSRGPTADGRLKPDVVAPGTNVLSLRSSHPDAEQLWGAYDSHYVWSGGTSMSTPLVTGSLAIIRQYYTEVEKLKFVSSALLKATIMNGAYDMYPGQFGDIEKKELPHRRPNIHEGWGRVDIDNTLFKPFFYLDERVGLPVGGKKTLKVKVLSLDKPLRFTMAYTDYPGSPSASRALVNDLDITITDPQGKIHFPNGLGKADRLNNVETIDILQPVVGVYTVEVEGYQIPQGKNGKQPFALVASGDFQKL
ncbi:MAG: S8 family serine peptidase [Deltaproteobacteria bacterium]|nr:S8 family serine peptidase [Deltaproteobacteria bacterium]